MLISKAREPINMMQTEICGWDIDSMCKRAIRIACTVGELFPSIMGRKEKKKAERTIQQMAKLLMVPR